MGQLVSLTDAPASHGASAPLVFRAPFFPPFFGQIVGEFTRSGSEPDVDVYNAQSVTKDAEIYVGLFPSSVIFDKVFDNGNVTIEVLNSTGGVVPSTTLPLSSTAEALALVRYTSPETDTYYYRVTPGSGLDQGEYVLVDTNSIIILGETMDGETNPQPFFVTELYATSERAAKYTDITVGGTPFETVASSVRENCRVVPSLTQFSRRGTL